MGNDIEARVGVAEAIKTLRRELEEAQAEGTGKAMRFAMDKIEVELSVDFMKGGEAGTGFKLLSIFDMSGKLKAEEKAAHKIKLTMSIKGDTTISGAAQAPAQPPAKPPGT
jgi:hypothetical protein